MSATPKVGVHLGVIGLHPLHFPPFVKVCFTPKHTLDLMGPCISRKLNVGVAIGGHVNRKGQKNSKSDTMSIGGMFTPSLINLDSLITNEEKVTVEVYLDEKNSPHSLKRVILVWLFDVKERRLQLSKQT